MNIFELLEARADTWKQCPMFKKCIETPVQTVLQSNFQLRNQNSITQSEKQIVINGHDYFQLFTENRSLFDGYSFENLQFSLEVLKDIHCIDRCDVKPIFIFQNWLQTPVNCIAEVRNNVSQFLGSVTKHQSTKDLVERLLDSEVTDLAYLSTLYIELLLRCKMELYSCDSDLNKTLVSFATQKRCDFMASSLECALLKKQVASVKISFLRAALFSSNYKELNGNSQINCEKFNDGSDFIQLIDPMCGPLLAFLSCNQDISLPPSFEAIELGEIGMQFGSNTRRTRSLIEWLRSTSFRKIAESILSLCRETMLPRMKNFLFSSVLRYTLQPVDNLSQLNLKSICITDLLHTDKQNAYNCNRFLTDTLNDNGSNVYQPDWPMILIFGYREEDPNLFVASVRHRFVTFTHTILRTIDTGTSLVGYQFESVNHLYKIQRRLLSEWMIARGSDEHLNSNFNRSVADTEADPSMAKSATHGFAPRFACLTGLNLQMCPESTEAQFIGCYLALWLKTTSEESGPLTPIVIALAASALVTYFYLKPGLGNNDELKQRIHGLVLHYRSVCEIIEHDSVDYEEVLSLETVRALARRIRELYYFVMEFRRLTGLLDVFSLFFQETPNTSKSNWSSLEYLNCLEFWALFPSNRLVYALTHLLERIPADQRLDKLCDKWISLMIPSSGSDHDSALQSVLIQIRWVLNFTTSSLSSVCDSNLNEPD